MLANELTQTIRSRSAARARGGTGRARGDARRRAGRATAGWWSSRAAPGSGRRGCWRRPARLPQAGDFEVLTARGGELEGEFAFGIVRQLFEAPLAAATPELRAELLAGAAELSASLVRVGTHERCRRGNRVLVRDAARPLLADRELRLAHADATRRRRSALGRRALRCAGSITWPAGSKVCRPASRGTRPPGQANLPVLVGELLADPAGVVMRPGGSGRESAAALARERLGDEPAAAFAAASRDWLGW